MNIKHENVPGQVQELVIEIQKEDYAENVDKALKKQRREIAVPGFRKGNAPMGICPGPGIRFPPAREGG